MKKKSYQKYIGLPFKHHGRDVDGIDCWGLPMLYYKEVLGVELQDWWYESDWSKKGENYFVDNYKDFHFERVDSPTKHDIALIFTDIKTKIPNHAMIIIEPPNIALTAASRGSHLTDLNNNVWKRRIEGFYRLCQD